MHLHLDHVVHRQAGARQGRGESVEHDVDLILDARRRFVGLRVDAEVAGERPKGGIRSHIFSKSGERAVSRIRR